jgi:TPR repeat protein
MNPLLGQNLGRWAEVYFTNPPEKREQAVRNLLQELQAQESLRDRSLQTSYGDTGLTSPKSFLPSQAINEPPALVDSGPVTTLPAQTSDVQTAGEARSNEGHAQDLGSNDIRSNDLSSNNAWPRKSAPARNRYRLYVGSMLVITVLALGYFAWRGSQTELGKSRTAPAPQAVPRESATPAQPQGITTDTSQQISAANNQPVPPSPIAPAPGAVSTNNESRTTMEPEKPVPSTMPATGSAETNPAANARAAKGAEELTMAKSYLNGSGGKARDSVKAVKWLWQAVALQNTEATELLADLYLKGEGVPKNCEQARILLEAAAHKGVQKATERLRHFQDSGCQ